MNQLLNISISDFKLVFRDPSLRTFLFMPVLVLLIIDVFLPWLAGEYEVVTEYVPYVIMAASLQTSTMFGFIYCMVFIDEKDTQVSKMYGILPVSKFYFILFRLLIPFLMSTFMTFVLLYGQPFFEMSAIGALIFALLAALVAPVFALSISILSKNKMTGMTWFKLINLLATLPLLAYFIPGSLGNIFGIVPTYWLFNGLEAAFITGDSLLPVGIGFLFSTLLLILLTLRFVRSHFA